MKPVRLAVLGAGAMGRKHAELIRAGGHGTLVGICDPDPRCRSVAEGLHVPFYGSPEELLEREKPEGAIIATPNALHAEHAVLCASHSVHILVEKPVADTLENAHRLVAAAEAAGVRVLVGHHRRHNPLVQEARAVVQGGAIGRLVAVSVLWTAMKPAEYYQVDWRCRRPGGGPALINLIHDFDTLRHLCGEIRQVYAQASSGVRRLEVEDSLAVTLSFENGVLGSITASDATPAPWSYEATSHENPALFPTDENCYYFLGTEGSLAFPRMEVWQYADPARTGWQHPLGKSRRPVAEGQPLAAQLEHFCRVIRDGETPLVDGREGSRTLAVALAVLESVQRGSPVLTDRFLAGI